MIGLRRTRVGEFSLADALTLDTLEAMPEAERNAMLLPTDQLLAGLPAIVLDRDAAYYLRQGQAIWQTKLQVHQRFRIYDEKQVFVGVGEVNAEGKLAPTRLVVQR